MQVGVTGASGFLGSHLTNALNKLAGFKVNTVKSRSLKKFSDINKLKSFVENLDLIYHIAGVNRGTNEEILEGNIKATFNLIEAIKKSKNSFPRIVFTSSSQVYKPLINSTKTINESHKTEPKTLFGITKKTAEDLIRASGFKHIILRIANTYGPGCCPEYNSVIATFCHKAINGDPINIDGDGHQKRDFIYIEDVVQAMILAGIKEGKLISGVYNIGSGHATSIRHVIRSIEMTGIKVDPIYTKKLDVGENSFALDASRFKKCFGWEPKTLPSVGIKNTLLWFKNKVVT